MDDVRAGDGASATSARGSHTSRAGSSADAPLDASGGRRGLPGWLEVPLLLVLAVLVALVVRTFVLQVFFIPSGSMEDTLQVGDRVLVNKVVYHLRPIERGDVVVFDGLDSFTPEVDPGLVVAEPDDPIRRALRAAASMVGLAPAGEHDFVKRVIGVAGDRVTCCDAEGRLSVNGVPLDESSYLYPGDAPSEDRFDIVVPEGRLWVMGDHRSASSDSRSHLGDPGGGTVPEDKVIGRVVAVVWPWSDHQVIEIPATFSQPGLTPRIED